MQILDNFSKAKILVVGDIMLDRYWWGSVSRISPEAPVPVVRLKRTSLAGGGAANVAANITGLGAQPILVGIIGNDEEAGLVKQILREGRVSADHLVQVEDRPTTVKTRIIAHSQQIARIDQENDSNLASVDEAAVMQKIETLIDAADVIVISDYAKGLLSEAILTSLIELSNSKIKSVLVDPKGKNYAKYQGASLLTPNKSEAAEACNLEENGSDLIKRAGLQLMSEISVGAVLITQGEDGMTLFRPDRKAVHFASMAREVYDVTGAGDTVIATLAASIGAGADLETAARLANIAAGLVVEQVGTTSITLDELRKHALDGQ